MVGRVSTAPVWDGYLGHLSSREPTGLSDEASACVVTVLSLLLPSTGTGE